MDCTLGGSDKEVDASSSEQSSSVSFGPLTMSEF